MDKQPGTGTQVPCCFCWFGRGLVGSLVSVKQPGSEPEYPNEEAEAPVAVLPSPLGYCLRVSCAMERWLPWMPLG